MDETPAPQPEVEEAQVPPEARVGRSSEALRDAVELFVGAIGRAFGVDASHLSPHIYQAAVSIRDELNAPSVTAQAPEASPEGTDQSDAGGTAAQGSEPSEGTTGPAGAEAGTESQDVGGGGRDPKLGMLADLLYSMNGVPRPEATDG